MTRASGHRINAAICVLVLAHAVYWLASGHIGSATTVRIALAVAQAALGLIGTIWFWRRARGAA
jgi:uncharacterized membrane protein (DUF485 family)